VGRIILLSNVTQWRFNNGHRALPIQDPDSGPTQPENYTVPVPVAAPRILSTGLRAFGRSALTLLPYDVKQWTVRCLYSVTDNIYEAWPCPQLRYLSKNSQGDFERGHFYSLQCMTPVVYGLLHPSGLAARSDPPVDVPSGPLGSWCLSRSPRCSLRSCRCLLALGPPE
jgi:hypothetical protein